MKKKKLDILKIINFILNPEIILYYSGMGIKDLVISIVVIKFLINTIIERSYLGEVFILIFSFGIMLVPIYYFNKWIRIIDLYKKGEN